MAELHHPAGHADEGVSWPEHASEFFIRWGEIVTPSREEIGETILDLIPAEDGEPFLAVELGLGEGWLSQAILERFTNARIVGLDGSPAMLDAARQRLQAFESRIDLRRFSLEDRTWLEEVKEPVRAFVSSLVVHHLDGPQKRQLYRDLYERLEDGGGLIISDIIAPASEKGRQHSARAWEAEVRSRSLVLEGSLDAYQRFLESHWNLFEHPDRIDKPSTTVEHLSWIQEAGFQGVDVFWARAGHAVYGGYR